jgi:hypothetical protein
LAYTEQAFTPVDGEVVATVQVSAATARSDDGLCGFEAALFEPRPMIGTALSWAVICLASALVIWPVARLLIGGN